MQQLELGCLLELGGNEEITMKPIKLAVLKKLRYIPVLNVLNFFLFSYNCQFLNHPVKELLKLYCIMCLSTLPGFGIYCLMLLIPSGTIIALCINAYITPLTFSCAMIYIYEKNI